MHEYNTRDWFTQLCRMQGSVLPLVAPQVLIITSLAIVLTWLENEAHVPALPVTPFTVLGTALGLLLTFRTNSSYDRFWEGRKAWGSIVNRSRNLARQLREVVSDAPLRQQFAESIVGFSQAAKVELWRDKAAIALCPLSAQGRLLQLGAGIQQLRREGSLDPVDQRRVDENVTVLMDQLGACERILKTPIPIGYVLHLRHFVIVYCLSLTLALTDALRWYSPLVIAFVAYIFLGIERIGIEIENPFEETSNGLNLEKISQTIRHDVFSILLEETDSK